MIHAGLLALVTIFSQGSQLEAHFVGNAGFSITDGEVTILTDLPYTSGSYGYMTYQPADIPTNGRTISLVTHRHVDHFDPDLFLDSDWEILGPEEVTRMLPEDRVITMESPTRVETLAITPLRTLHRDTEHYSYLVEWNGLRLYIVGDTDDPSQLLAQRDLDYLFVTPWMAGILDRRGLAPDARNVILYHHKVSEVAGTPCERCIVPVQGQTIRLVRPPGR